jgi:uncharacterized protein YbaP (TraB family)
LTGFPGRLRKAEIQPMRRLSGRRVESMIFANSLTCFLRNGLAALFLLPSLAYADAPVAPSDAQTAHLQSDAGPNRGILYRVTDGAGTLYLFGTIHLGKPEFYPLNRLVTDAVRSSNVLAVEADVTDTAAITKQIADAATYPGADTLDRHISPALMQRLERLLEKYGFPLAPAKKMKPWMLAMALDYIGGSDAGYSPLYGADVYLLSLARGMKKPVAEVESMAFQINLFEGLTPAEQEDFLASTVDAVESGELRAQLVELVDAWAKADGAAIAKTMEEGEAAYSPAEKWITTKLITDRNVSMTRRVEEYLHSGKQYFVAVGAGHLVGEGGIIARLKAKGYKVRDMQ